MIGISYPCSVCAKEIKKGEFIACAGKVGGILTGGLKLFALRFGYRKGGWPFVENPKIYCESCLNKQFKKK